VYHLSCIEDVYATKYVPDDNIITAVIIEAMPNAVIATGRIIGDLQCLLYVLLILLFSSLLTWFLALELTNAHGYYSEA
jgi:hypothetical protein